tara:strand:- start:211 stop:495 length:285 start_codon:yes stop_codon:yes gene_type:complete
MESIARLGLFGFAYLTIYIISNMVASANTNENTTSIFFENFHGTSFLIVSLILGGWVYFVNYREKEAPRNLKEILYIFTFVCGFTSFAGFLGYC